MVEITSHHPLNTIYEVDRTLFSPPKKTLARWAIEKIDFFHEKGSNTIPSHLAGLLKRLLAVAMPVFAALDALQQGGKIIWNLCSIKPDQAFYELLNCGKSICLFFISIPSIPLALVSPLTLYRTPERWKQMGVNQSHKAAVSLLKADLDAWATDKLSESAAKKILEVYDQHANTLDLKSLQLKYLPQCIERLTWLKTLRLNSNNFETIPKEIYKLRNLKELHLGNNKIHSISKDIAKLSKLEKLDLSHNALHTLSFPSELGKLTKLTRLDLSKNDLKSLPLEIGTLTKLKSIDLSETKLKSLPNVIGLLTGLERLYVNNNEICSLSNKIGNLKELVELNINNNHIKFLPPEIGQLAKLEYVNLRYNMLETLPKEMGQLPFLELLYLENNKLESLPGEIGQLPLLRGLFLSRNQLVSIPEEFGELMRLEMLTIATNQLTSLPGELGQLAQLKMLDLYQNSALNQLPLGLGQAPELTWINIEETGISEELRDAILQQCQASRMEAAVKVLPVRLKSWKVAGKSEVPLSEIEKFEKGQKIQINEWLVRLERTKDFRSDTQSALAKTVCEMLGDVIKNEPFKELFFAQITSNLEGCEDRAAMALNEIYTSWRLSKLDDTASVTEKLQIMGRGAKTLALRAAIAGCIDQHQKLMNNVEKEAVEIYLYYETALKEELNLLCATEKMAYGQIGKRAWIDEKSLVDTVTETYLDHLITFPVFEKMIAKDETYNAAYEKNVEPLDEEVLNLLEKEPQDVDEFSTTYLDWQAKVGELNVQRQQALAKVKKAWALQKLK